MHAAYPLAVGIRPGHRFRGVTGARVRAYAGIACRYSIITSGNYFQTLRTSVIWIGLATPVRTHLFAPVGS